MFFIPDQIYDRIISAETGDILHGLIVLSLKQWSFLLDRLYGAEFIVSLCLQFGSGAVRDVRTNAGSNVFKTGIGQKNGCVDS